MSVDSENIGWKYPNGWVYYHGEGWRHRPRWKVAINTVLRALQRGRTRKLVVATISTKIGSPPRILGYKLAFVEHKP